MYELNSINILWIRHGGYIESCIFSSKSISKRFEAILSNVINTPLKILKKLKIYILLLFRSDLILTTTIISRYDNKINIKAFLQVKNRIP